jgi:hypothetical protein
LFSVVILFPILFIPVHLIELIKREWVFALDIPPFISYAPYSVGFVAAMWSALVGDLAHVLRTPE